MHEPLYLLVGFFVVALLYSSVGHGGATGYLALVALLALPLPAKEASTTALLLNCVVAGIALAQFASAGHLPWRLAAPFLVTSVPAAFIGGRLEVETWLFHALLILGLAAAALRLLFFRSHPDTAVGGGATCRPPLWVALVVGAVIGAVSGIVGIGGGVFLSPLLILLRWVSPRDTAGVAASFVLLNSLSGLLARATAGTFAVGMFWLPLAFAVMGGLIGSYLGARRWMPSTLNRVLGGVLCIACGKLAMQLVEMSWGANL